MTESTESIPEEFWQGVAEFNQGKFYACHDTLEALWMEAREPEKTFYQGVLQIAVALYHLNNHNLRGAVILLGEGTHRLRRYQPSFSEIDVSELIQQSSALLTTLQHTQPDQVAELVQQMDTASTETRSPHIQRVAPPEA
jgi:uncharacterized protein